MSSMLDNYPLWQQELLRRDLHLPPEPTPERRLTDAEWEAARRQQHDIIESFRMQGREQALREIAARPNRARAMQAIRRMEEQDRRMYGPRPTTRNPVIAVVNRRIGEDGPGKTRGYFARDLEAALARYPGSKEISLIICCHGGRALEAPALYGRLRALALPISARVIGSCCSCAIELLLSADYREGLASSRYVLHNAAIAPTGLRGRWTAQRHQDTARFIERHDADRLAFISHRTGTSVDRLRKLITAETVLTAEMARDVRLIHVIADDANGLMCHR